MLEPEERQELKKGMFVIKVIWGAFCSALIIYLIICHLVGSNAIPDFDSYTLWIIKATLGVITCISLAIAYFLRKVMLKIRYTGSSPYIILHMFTLNSQPLPYVQHRAVTTYTTAIILSIAFSESVGIFGLILFLISGEFITLYAFVIVSAIALLFFRPRSEELEQLAINLKRQPDSSNPS